MEELALQNNPANQPTIKALKNDSLNRSLNDSLKRKANENINKQAPTNAVCSCGQILLDKSSIRDGYWQCSRCNSRNKIPEGYKIETADDVSLGGESGVN